MEPVPAPLPWWWVLMMLFLWGFFTVMYFVSQPVNEQVFELF